MQIFTIYSKCCMYFVHQQFCCLYFSYGPGSSIAIDNQNSMCKIFVLFQKSTALSCRASNLLILSQLQIFNVLSLFLNDKGIDMKCWCLTRIGRVVVIYCFFQFVHFKIYMFIHTFIVVNILCNIHFICDLRGLVFKM